ncbi:MAG: uroporphyrinogen-III C-methyltransferase [Sedimentisphaerales bacterium]|nr:uroporphyrinogen-III C-methyltransferase [Sedimentisphaerales bacterium]
MSYGKVYFVGAGPGDVELITLKGYKLICQADVVLHDHLIPLELLGFARGDAEIISVGKFAGRHTMPQEKINKLLIEKAREQKVVVRLKGGDPLLFGRGAEEAEACAEGGVDFEFVPGVTSTLAAPCYGGIPPTHRDFTSHIAIVTGHRKEEMEIEIPKAGTIIFLMGVSNIEKIVKSLLKAGWSKQAKIAAIEKGTRYDQRVIQGTLNDFIEVAKREKIGTPAVFIVGKVVELRDKLDWFGKKPRIFLPGTHPEKYRHLGIIIHRPLIKSVPLEDYSQADNVLKSLGVFDWIIFTSTNGVKFFFQRLNAIGLDTRAISTAKISAIGKTTAEKLRTFGIIADMQPNLESSVGLLEEFKKISVKNKKILLVRPKFGSSTLLDGLTDMKADVEAAVVYKNVDIKPEETDFNFIDQILFTSGSTIRAFLKVYGSVPDGIKVYCLGQPTLDEANRHNIAAELLP